jgi:hypothetical protein
MNQKKLKRLYQSYKEMAMQARLLLLAAMALAPMVGCATTSAEPEPKTAPVLEAEMVTMMERYGPACVRLGYEANSEGWRNCILVLSQRDSRDKKITPAPHYYHPAPFGWGPSPIWNPGFRHWGYW